MMNSLWIAKTGMTAQQTQLDVISHNLSNNSPTDPPSMISAVSPSAEASICASELPWPASLARPPIVPVLGAASRECGNN